MRLDKLLASQKCGSRSEVKEMIKKGQVSVNDEVVKSPDLKVDEKADRIECNGCEIVYEEFVYYMLNKPAEVVTATKDNFDRTVIDLIDVPKKASLIPVGRLDKDTEGLLLLTDDGVLCHELLSPKKHVDKTYYVRLKNPITEADMDAFNIGINIGDDDLTNPAVCEILDNANECNLTIREGRFHQVKRMFHERDNEVLYLKRIRMGQLILDDKLALGEYRALTKTEIRSLHAN